MTQNLPHRLKRLSGMENLYMHPPQADRDQTLSTTDIIKTA